jgi:UDP-N-acetylglucosamine 2-epimerase (non-hydrolysing)
MKASTQNGSSEKEVRMPRVLTVFGTRPEVIKLAPVIHALRKLAPRLEVFSLASAQHTTLLQPFLELFGLSVHASLDVMRENQTPDEVCSRILKGIRPVLERESPDIVLVQGDTTTALAAAMAAFHHRIPIGHVEAGLRSGDRMSPFPEEMNRRLISQLATFHFAATDANRGTLVGEGIPAESVFVTGNPVVDALRWILERHRSSPRLSNLLSATRGMKRVLLTTHRRESHGPIMARNLFALKRFVHAHEDVAVIFPVHPNPAVQTVARRVLAETKRVHLEEPMGYDDFIGLAAQCWLIVSDSGGVQEEAPSLGKPLLVLRDNTERPEALEAGVAKLVGGREGSLAELLEEAYEKGSWVESVGKIENPFGDGHSGEHIASVVARLLGVPQGDAFHPIHQEEMKQCPLPG